MRTVSLVLIAAAVLAVPAAASEPGQPLDCSDWVFLEPGLSCAVAIAPDCSTDPRCLMGQTGAVDSAGRLLRLTRTNTSELCGSHTIAHVELHAYDPRTGSEMLLAYAEDRCVLPGTIELWEPFVFPTQTGSTSALTFDPTRGVLYVPLRSYCGPNSVGAQSACNFGVRWLAAISGFTTTFEILQSYEPATNTWGFRVPYMPEGIPAADYFDTYYGDLATVGNWSQTQPLQCGFPGSPASVGDYLTVADPLPNPAQNAGRYYVTAVSHQGHRRYGRQRLNGVLSGRDPAVLPGCEAM